MAADSTIRPTHGGYQDAFPEAAMLNVAREIAAQVHDGWPDTDFGALLAGRIRRGDGDDLLEVKAALAALKWRFYAQPQFRAAVAP